MRVLISGASVAGPMAAYWLCRQGFAVTVVERMPLTLVRTSGHAVDLFGPAMDVAEWTGVLPAVTDARTRTEIVSFQRLDGRGVDVDVRRLVAGISGRHVEIMRGELATILYEATFMRRPEATRGICSRNSAPRQAADHPRRPRLQYPPRVRVAGVCRASRCPTQVLLASSA